MYITTSILSYCLIFSLPPFPSLPSINPFFLFPMSLSLPLLSLLSLFLRNSNTMFIDYIKRLESHKRCQSLSVTSFLLLPMQRITRLPLLVLAILNRLSSDHPLYSQVEDTLRAVQKVNMHLPITTCMILFVCLACNSLQ